MPGAPAPQGPYAQVAAQPQMTQQQAVSMFQAGPAQRTQATPSSPFQTASQSSHNPVEIVFPTGPANAPPPTAPQVTIPQGPEETSFRVGDEGPQLLPPVTE